ncbi:MAG TPA: metallophosphoesterase [Vicinamibacteria bacterium]|nr:metallophosphoesterase [Vicinamibacteria bacterium]
MRAIAHISDLHFGREDAAVAEALRDEIAARSPLLVAVSGDLTQRARTREFRAARAFLDALPGVVLVVPGNHDVPLWDVFARFASPLRNYRRHLTAELAPFFHQEDLAVMGLNTARSWTFKNGRVSWAQIEQIRDRFAPLPERVFKVLVTHHPFIPAPGDPDPRVVGRGLQALQAAEAAGVDLLLAGHLHLGFCGDVRAHHLSLRRSMLVAQAGTAISLRTRKEPNTYNWITVDGPRLVIEVRGWAAGGFTTLSATRWLKRDAEWERESP